MKDVRLVISASVDKAEREIAKLAATGQQVTSVLEQSFAQLGTRSSMSIEAQKAAYVGAFERIRSSGIATWQEIQTAHAAMTAKVAALDAGLKPQGIKSVTEHLNNMGSAVERLTPRFVGLVGTLAAFYVGSKLWDGFKFGIQAVDDFQQSVVKTAAMITSLQGGSDLAGNYQRAKQYAEGLNEALMQVDSRTNLNLTSLQSITEEMVKQGVVLDYTNEDQIEGFTRLANAVAVYSRNGADEKQLRQEVSALLKGQVDQNSQLSSMLQRTVDGPLKQQVEKWKDSGTLVKELGDRLGGFGPASDDLATSWSSVKSSLETSMNLVMRAGFTEIVKDVAGWLGTINEYLKSHREEIGEKIRGAWETAKSLMQDAATIAKAVYNNFEPFAALFIGGALITGLTRAVGLFTTMRDLAVSTRAAMLGIGMISAGAGVAGAATTAGVAGAAGAAGGVAAGAGVMGTVLIGGGAALAGLGLGYGLQPLVRMADKSLYNNFGINLTGEEMYNQEQQKMADADTRWRFFQSQHANSPQNRAVSSSIIPQLNLGESQEQIKDRISLQSKELAAFKAAQEAETTSAKEQAGIQLSILKANYGQGLIATQDYYEKENSIALVASQKKFDNAAEYLRKEQALLEYIGAKKGTDSLEYNEELARNRKIVQEMQSAQVDYAETYLAGEEKMRASLQSRNEAYSKARIQALEDAGNFSEAEALRQESYRNSKEYLQLEADALAGNEAAWQAMMDLKKREAGASLAATQKKIEAEQTYAGELAVLQDRLDALNGKDADAIKLGSDLRAGLKAEADLRDRLATAWAKGNQSAITALSSQIQLQQQLNNRLQSEIDLYNRKMELTGQIVGYNGNTPIYADSYQKQQAATAYVSNGVLTGGGVATGKNYWGEDVDKFGNVVNPFNMPNLMSFDGARASGGPVSPYGTYLVGEKGPEILRMGSQGGAVIPIPANINEVMGKVSQAGDGSWWVGGQQIVIGSDGLFHNALGYNKVVKGDLSTLPWDTGSRLTRPQLMAGKSDSELKGASFYSGMQTSSFQNPTYQKKSTVPAITAAESSNKGSRATTLTNTITITIENRGTTAATIDALARQLAPKLNELNRRRIGA